MYTIHYHHNHAVSTTEMNDYRAACACAHALVHNADHDFAVVTSNETGKVMQAYVKGN